jgi:hypothetical protein
MNANAIIGITATLVGCVVGLIIYMQTASGNSNYLAKSKWELTLAATDNTDETAQTWYVDTANGAIRVQTLDGEGTLRVQEFVGNQMFDYQMRDPEQNMEMDTDAFCAAVDPDTYDGDCYVLAAESAADGAVLAEQTAGDKMYCEMEIFDGAVQQVAVAENGNVVVGGFKIKMVDGLPAAILNGEDDTIMATIDSIEEVADDLDISGCSDDDGSDDRRFLGMLEAIGESRRRRTTEGEVDAEVQTARDHLNDIYMGMLAKTEAGTELTDQAARHLDWQNWNTQTDWCGASDTRATAPCPGSAGMTGGVDDNAACHRHDHGAYFEMTWGGIAARLTCDNDALLDSNSEHWLVQWMFGRFGALGAMIGCLDEVHGKTMYYYSFFGWTWAREIEEDGKFVRFGIGRFNLISKSFGWVDQGYVSGSSVCVTKFTDDDGRWLNNPAE